MPKLAYGFVGAEGGKTTAGASGKSASVKSVAGGYTTRRTVSWDIAKDFFRLGRSFIDVVGTSMGIPMQQVRQQLRNEGIDPNRMDEIMSQTIANDIADGSFNEYTPDTFNEQVYQAQILSSRTPALPLLVGVVAGIFLLGMIRR